MVASRQERVLPNFRQGDAVVLYERNTDTDNVTNKMVFKGNIERISDNEVCIRLRATQQNAGVLPAASLYAIEHDYMDTFPYLSRFTFRRRISLPSCYSLRPQSIQWVTLAFSVTPSLLIRVQEYLPVFHPLRLSASR